MTQSDTIHQLDVPVEQKRFTSQRALAQYIGVISRSDICAKIQLVTPGASVTTRKEYNSLAKTVAHLHQTRMHGLKFEKLDMATIYIIFFADAKLTTTREPRSQMGFVITMADASGRCNVLHYSSAKCRSVTSSVTTAEIDALVFRFDHVFVVRDLVEEMLDCDVPF